MVELEKIIQEAKKSQLLIHKIPHSVTSQELQGLITGDFTLDVKVIIFTINRYFFSRGIENHAFV